jgi:SAM-dependent methyltransferase
VFEHASVDTMQISDESLDFAYSLGVLHHVPDAAHAISVVAAKLKLRAPFLVYLYYAFDNRPFWYRWLWRVTDAARRAIARLPHGLRYFITQIIAAFCYWPLARLARGLDRMHVLPGTWPLAYYRDKSFYVMRNDARDRFGTVLEQRFTRGQITTMLDEAGFEEITFSDRPPYWCATGVKSDRAST